MHYADGDALSRMSARKPGWHFSKEANCFSIEGFVAAFNDFDMGNIAVGIHYETASDAPFDAAFVCVGGILTVFVDVVKKCFISTGE